MLPIFALAPLMGLAQDWFTRRQEQSDATESAGKVRDLLGSAPSLMYPGQDESGQQQQGPPQQLDQGSGLMANPADPQRQLAFMQGVMGLRPAERRAAGALFSDVMARAQQQQLGREQLAQQGQEASDREAGVNARFDAQLEQAKNEFADKRKQWGDALALDWFKARQDHILKAQEIALNALKLDAAKQPPSNVQLGGVGQNEARVVTPDGGIEVVPLPGSERHDAAVDTVNGLTDAYQQIKRLRDSVAKHGTEAFGAEARNQATAHKLAVGALNRVFEATSKGPQAGRYSEARIKDLNDLLEDPSGWGSSLKGNTGILQNYDTLLGELEDKFKQTQQRTQNWPGINRAPLSEAAAAREVKYQRDRGAPPPPKGTLITGTRG